MEFFAGDFEIYIAVLVTGTATYSISACDGSVQRTSGAIRGGLLSWCRDRKRSISETCMNIGRLFRQLYRQIFRARSDIIYLLPCNNLPELTLPESENLVVLDEDNIGRYAALCADFQSTRRTNPTSLIYPRGE